MLFNRLTKSDQGSLGIDVKSWSGGSNFWLLNGQYLRIVAYFLGSTLYLTASLVFSTLQSAKYRLFDSLFLFLFSLTMRKITKETATALKECKKTKIWNTEVIVLNWTDKFWNYTISRLFLHSHMIWEFQKRETGEKMLSIYDMNWQTNTTKERLNGILTVFGINDWIYQKNWKWYTQDWTEWTGSKYYTSKNYNF